MLGKQGGRAAIAEGQSGPREARKGAEMQSRSRAFWVPGAHAGSWGGCRGIGDLRCVGSRMMDDGQASE